jgi:hypothetical protein
VECERRSDEQRGRWRGADARLRRVPAALLLLAAGFLAAAALAACGSGSLRGKISTAIGNVTVPTRTATVTSPGSTVQRTVQETVQVETVPAATTAAPTTTGSEGGGTPTWVWVLAAVAAVIVVVLLVWLIRRGRGPSELPIEERRRIVANAAQSWMAQGWAIEHQSEDSAVLRRGDQRLLLSVDARGRVATSPSTAPAPPPSPS